MRIAAYQNVRIIISSVRTREEGGLEPPVAPSIRPASSLSTTDTSRDTDAQHDRELEWVGSGDLPSALWEWPAWEGVSRNPMQGPLRRIPWRAPIWDAGASGNRFVLGLLRKHAAFLGGGYPPRPPPPRVDGVHKHVQSGVSVHDFLAESHKGTSADFPYNEGKFPGATFVNRIPLVPMPALVARRCVVKWTGVQGPAGPEQPRTIQALFVEENKTALDLRCSTIEQGMQDDPVPHGHRGTRGPRGVGRVFSGLARRFIGFPPRISCIRRRGHCSGCGIYQDVDYVWTVLPLRWCESPYVCHALREVTTASLRSKGVPALAYINHP